MDLGSLSAYGRSTTSTAWATNPVRRLLLWLIAPYLRGAANEIAAADERRLQEFAVQGEHRLQNLEAALQEFALQEEVRLRNLEVSLPAKVASELRVILASEMRVMLATESPAILASEFGGLRKDAGAVAYRLGGLEEQTASAEQVQARHAEWLRNVETLVQAHSTDLSDLHTASHQLMARMDNLIRGDQLRPGQRFSVGDSGLVIVQTGDGRRLLVRQQDHIGGIIAQGREWEPHVREGIEDAAQPDGVAIDAGAYIGIHTLTMARLFGTVHAFEPQRGIYQILCGNLALNDCSNVVTHNIALYDRNGSVKLAPQERQEIATPLKDGQPDYAQISNAAALSFDFITAGGEVRAIALDSMELEKVRVIKIDTQGADLCVLRGAMNTIQRCQPVVLFEWERDLARQHNATLGDFYSFFSELHYEVAMIHNTTPDRQADYIAKPL